MFFFYKTTPDLFPKEQETVFGVIRGASLNGYEINLATELLSNPKIYLMAAGKTYFGFLISPIALNTDLVNLVPENIRNKYLTRFENMPKSIYLQTFLLLFLWGMFGFIFGKLKNN